MCTYNTITPVLIGLDIGCDVEAQAWHLILSGSPTQVAKDVSEALAGADVVVQRIQAAEGPIALLRSPSAASRACVVEDTWHWPDESYGKLDLHRDAIRAAWPVLVWVTTPQAAALLTHRAPNFAAFFQASTATWSDGDISDMDKDSYLAAFRERYRQTDAEIIIMAEEGTLPNDADRHAWLVLLGRGDLIRAKRS